MSVKKPLRLVPHPREEGIKKPAPGAAADVLEAAASCARRGVRAAMATVIERHGSAPGTPGQKLVLGADGTCVGTVGGGAVERDVLLELERVLSDRRAKHATRTFALGAE